MYCQPSPNLPPSISLVMAHLQWTSSGSRFLLSPTPATTPPVGAQAGTLASSPIAESSLSCSFCGGLSKDCPRCSKQQFAHASSSTPLMFEKQLDYGSNAQEDTDSCDDSNLLEVSVKCECHKSKRPVDDGSESSKTARNKLIIACIIALGFTVAEVIGMLANCIC